MTKTTCIAVLLLICAATPCQAAAPEDKQTPAQEQGYRKLKWKDLIPPGWDPAKEFRSMDFDRLDDSDPRAIAALKKMQNMWNQAPVRKDLNGVRVFLPGYVVALDPVRDGNIREFLLVPFFGSCIHTPPPPGNQIVLVVSPQHLSQEQRMVLRSAAVRMGAISVRGMLETVSSTTSIAVSGYRLKADDLAHYYYQGGLDHPR